MKRTDRWIAALLAAALAVCLCACGTAQPEPEATEEPVPTEAVPASNSSTDDRVPPASASETAETSETTPAPEPEYPEGYADAQHCVGQPVEELYAAVGEPESSQYAASCETDGAEDGMLFYDGFYVWTVRTDEEELVRAVYLDD